MRFEVKNLIQLQAEIARLCAFLTEQEVPAERIFDSRLVASELIGNALRHSKEGARLHAEIRDGCVEIIVFSKTVFTPPKTSVCSGVYSESGRGLFLVDSVCEERDMTEDGGIKVRIRITENV